MKFLVDIGNNYGEICDEFGCYNLKKNQVFINSFYDLCIVTIFYDICIIYIYLYLINAAFH